MSYIDPNEGRYPYSHSYIAGTNIPEDPAKFMGQAGLAVMTISVFFFPFLPIGFIICLMAKSRSKKYGFINPPATLGITIGLVLLGIAIFIISALLIHTLIILG